MNWLTSGLFALLIVILLLLGILLGIDNSDLVSLKLLNYSSPQLPTMAWVIIALILGMCLGFLLGKLRIK